MLLNSLTKMRVLLQHHVIPLPTIPNRSHSCLPYPSPTFFILYTPQLTSFAYCLKWIGLSVGSIGSKINWDILKQLIRKSIWNNWTDKPMGWSIWLSIQFWKPCLFLRIYSCTLSISIINIKITKSSKYL